MPLLQGPLSPPVLSPASTVFLLGLVALAYFGASGAIPFVVPEESREKVLELGTSLTQWLLFLALPMTVVLSAGKSFRMSFSWYPPRFDLLILTVATALCLVGVVQYLGDLGLMYLAEPYDRLFDGILPSTTDRLEESAKLFETGTTVGLVVVLLLAAVTPAICEEHFFRGVVQSSLGRRIPPVAAVLCVSVVFATFHFEPVTFGALLFIGAVMGLFTVRSNCLLYACLIHFTNNALSVVVQHVMSGHLDGLEGGQGSFDSMPVYILGAFIGILAFVARTPRLRFLRPMGLPAHENPPLFQPGPWHRVSVWLAGRWRVAAFFAAVCSATGLALDIRDLRDIASSTPTRPAAERKDRHRKTHRSEKGSRPHDRKDEDEEDRGVPQPQPEDDGSSILNVRADHDGGVRWTMIRATLHRFPSVPSPVTMFRSDRRSASLSPIHASNSPGLER